MFKKVLLLLSTLLLSACASQPSRQVPSQFSPLWQDEAFAPQLAVPSEQAILEPSPAMAAYIDTLNRPRSRRQALRDLVRKVFDKNRTRISYDASQTRTPGEVFASQLGNCLSLALYTKAMADAWDLSARVQSVPVPPRWTRSGDIILLSRHVNLRVRITEFGQQLAYGSDHSVIDFERGYSRYDRKAKPLDDRQTIALFYQNRGGELLAEGQDRQAYWYIQAALLADPGLAIAWSALGLLYRRKGFYELGRQAYERALLLEPENAHVWANYSVLLAHQQDQGASRHAATQAQRFMPDNPYPDLEKGEALLAQGKLDQAQRHFESALAVDSINDDALAGLARVWEARGSREKAAQLFEQASFYAFTEQQRQAYLREVERLGGI